MINALAIGSALAVAIPGYFVIIKRPVRKGQDG
jgi:hypothetical protein